MSRDEIALRIFCALVARTDSTFDLYPELGEKQIRTCFHLADVFLRVTRDREEHIASADLTVRTR